MRQFLGTIHLIVAIALMALIGQGILYILAGRNREQNLFYQIICIITRPFVSLVRMLTPRVFEDRHIPFATFCLLAVVFIWLMLAIPGVDP